jgi:hypothetical protein
LRDGADGTFENHAVVKASHVGTLGTASDTHESDDEVINQDLSSSGSAKWVRHPCSAVSPSARV